jgi:hypothetical protein
MALAPEDITAIARQVAAEMKPTPSETDFTALPPHERAQAVRDSIATKLAQTPRVDTQGRPIAALVPAPEEGTSHE